LRQFVARIQRNPPMTAQYAAISLYDKRVDIP